MINCCHFLKEDYSTLKLSGDGKRIEAWKSKQTKFVSGPAGLLLRVRYCNNLNILCIVGTISLLANP